MWLVLVKAIMLSGVLRLFYSSTSTTRGSGGHEYFGDYSGDDSGDDSGDHNHFGDLRLRQPCEGQEYFYLEDDSYMTRRGTTTTRRGT